MSAPRSSDQSAHPGKTSTTPVFLPNHPFLGRPSSSHLASSQSHLPSFHVAQSGLAQFSSTDIRLRYKYNPHRAAVPAAGPVYLGMGGRQAEQKDNMKLGESVEEKLGDSKQTRTETETDREKVKLVAEGLKFLREHRNLLEEERLKKGEIEIINSSCNTIPKCHIKEACPSWMVKACETDSDEEGLGNRNPSGLTTVMSSLPSVQEGTERSKQTPQCIKDVKVVPTGGAKSSPAVDDGDVIPGESLIQGYILTECHSLRVELLDCPSALQPCALAAQLCGFLNSGGEGALYLGVRRSGEVIGLPLSKAGRQETRQQVCTALTHCRVIFAKRTT